MATASQAPPKALKRIMKEYEECSKSPPAGMSIALPANGDIKNWIITLEGPPTTPYAKGVFTISLLLPDEYPFKPPTVRFHTRIYHPNVTNDSAGTVCLAALKGDAWKPASRLEGVLVAVRALLLEPQPDDPMEAHIAEEYLRNRPEFENNAKTYVKRYAMGSVPVPVPMS